MKHTSLVLIVGAAVTGVALSACGGSSSSTSSGEGGMQSVKVAYTPITAAGVLKVGEAQGFFKEEGIELSMQPVDNPPAGIAAVAGGQVNFNYAPTIPVINAVANGVKIKVAAPADGYKEGTLAAVEADPKEAAKYDDTAILVRDDAIKSPKDLSGKSVSVPARGAQLEVTIANAVKEDGGDPASLEWITLDFPSALSSLKDDRIKGAGVVQPFIGKGEKEGARNISSPGVTFFGDGAVGVWVTNEKFATDSAKTVSGFQRAVAKSNEYANANPDAVFKASAELLKIDEATLKEGATPYYPTTVTVEDVSKVADKLTTLGFLKKPVDANTLVIPAP